MTAATTQGQASWAGTPSIKGGSEAVRMALLTVSLVGIQFTWGIEMTYCTPFLLALGLRKSTVALVWIAGPLSGLMMQPLVGVLADRSKSRHGRRRPFMLAGAAVAAAALLLLGWTKSIAHLFGGGDGAAVALAVTGIYVLDFAINAVQASARSLIVDTLPISKQQLGSAWAGRMIAVGHLVGYGAGALNLGGIFGSLMGDTQFKRLTVIAAISLCLCTGVTAYAVHERVLVSTGSDERRNALQNTREVLAQLYATATNLPPRIRLICWAQFWCWIAWFPFLFYTSTWVGEIYLRSSATASERASAAHRGRGDNAHARQEDDTLGRIGRVGSMALVVFSLVALLASAALPWVVRAPDEEGQYARHGGGGRVLPPFASRRARPPAGLAPLLERLDKHRPGLLNTWIVSHMIFACSMVLAPFVESLRAATATVAVCGIPWALTCWAPYTFMGVEINKLNAPSPPTSSTTTTTTTTTRHYRSVSLMSVESDPGILRLHHSPDDPTSSPTSSSTGELAGVYLGILNVYCSLPQFLGTAVSWAVFTVFDRDDDGGGEGLRAATGGTNAIGVCLSVGALAALGAAYVANRLRYDE